MATISWGALEPLDFRSIDFARYLSLAVTDRAARYHAGDLRFLGLPDHKVEFFGDGFGYNPAGEAGHRRYHDVPGDRRWSTPRPVHRSCGSGRAVPGRRGARTDPADACGDPERATTILPVLRLRTLSSATAAMIPSTWAPATMWYTAPPATI